MTDVARASAHLDRDVRLHVEALRVCIGSATGPDVVDEIRFDVGRGEVLGLVGESGSGKSTVALALLGYTRHGLAIAGGRVALDGVDLLALEPRTLRSMRGSTVAYVPQDPASALNPALRIGTQMREMLHSHADASVGAEERIRAVLADVALPTGEEVLRSYPHQLSGGQQQRIAIAIAFLCSPSLIVFDEPTTGLDVTTQRHVLETVQRLCSDYGIAGVYVSHDLAVVSGLASRVAVMYAGRIVEAGPTGRVLGRPVHPYTRRLIAAVPAADKATVLRGIEGRPPRPGSRPTGCSYAPRCDFALDICSQPGQPPTLEVDGTRVRCVRAHENLPERRAESVTIIETGPEQASAAVISVADLTAAYRGYRVLEGAALSVGPESCVAIVGESGSGKTTLARCVAGLHREFTGVIELDGQALPPSFRDRSTDALRRIQYIFQNPYTSLNPRKTIRQIVDRPLSQFFSLRSTERDGRIRQALHDVSLADDVLDRYPDQLSGGERQRVAIARGLVAEPDVLICDEVTSALDVSVQATIVELLKRLQHDRHLAIVFITHNLALVRSLAESVAVLADGRIVEFGATDTVIDHPSAPYTARLMADLPRMVTAGSLRSLAAPETRPPEFDTA